MYSLDPVMYLGPVVTHVQGLKYNSSTTTAPPSKNIMSLFSLVLR